MAEGETTTFDDILAEVTARTATARVLLRQDLLERHAELDAALGQAVAADARDGSLDSGGDVQRLAAELAEFEAEIEAAKRPFKFRSIGKKAWADLLAEHPPTKEQRQRNPRLDHNPETFPAAAIAASVVAPALSVEQVQKLEVAVNATQFDELWQACLDANLGGNGSPKSSLAALTLRANGQSSLPPSSSASPGASSSDE